MGQEDREDREFGAEQMGALFRTVLDQREPAVPPVGPQVRRAGARLRLRRRLLTVTAAAVAVAAVATAGVAVTGRSGPTAPVAAPTTAPTTAPMPTPTTDPTPSAAATPSATDTPVAPNSADPVAADWQLSAAGHAELLRFLRDHPLPGVTGIEENASSREFTMHRANDGRVRFMREFNGLVGSPDERESPCTAQKLPNGDPADPFGTDCLTVPLPDGALAWVLHPAYRDQPKAVWIWLVTAQGRKFVLSFDSAPVDGAYTPLPLEAVRGLAATPGFVRAVDEGWRDSAVR
ncbi:hypothetical protein ACFVFS_27505 [Kitasatospora sp. NPDC057692]|uniref:hypothetical protein n=1 Tax=Kitasatospora sp. NPDC057692 TaxID=3346215 RepID=UPI0036BDBE8D